MEFPVSLGLLEPFATGAGDQDWLEISPNPVAGANLPVAVEARNWLRVLAARVTLTTDANVANRVLSLDYISARGLVYLRNFAPLAVTAGLAATVFHWSEQVTSSEWAANTPIKVALSSVFLAPASVVQFTLDNKQVGDQLASASLFVERFPTGPTGYGVGYTADVPTDLEEARAGEIEGPKPPATARFPSSFE